MLFIVKLYVNAFKLVYPLFSGTYKDGLGPDGKILSDHMLLGSVVATILIIDNTTQVRHFT